jgi:hypothetical protein
MQFEAFRASLDAAAPPAGVSLPLQALWWDGKEAWDRAHACVADAAGHEAAWVHAYLHRKEGDLGNARYWYGRAGRPPSQEILADEWASIATALLGAPAAGGKA